MLSAAGRLRRHLRGIDGIDRVGAVWHRIGKSEMRQLHGSLRLRSVGRSRWFLFGARLRSHGSLVSVHRLSRSRRRAIASGTGASGPRAQPVCEHPSRNTSERNAAGMSEIQNPETLEVVPGFSHDQLEGWIPPLATDGEIRGALEKAFDYRGDVTITLKNGTQVEGYIF